MATKKGSVKPKTTGAEFKRRSKASSAPKMPGGPADLESKPLEKRPRGREPWIPTEKTAEETERLMAMGYRYEDLAKYLGIGLATLYEKLNDYPELSDAIKKGRNKHLQNNLEPLSDLVKEKNLGAICFSLKTIHNFREENVSNPEDEARNKEANSDGVLGALRRIKIRRKADTPEGSDNS